MSKKEGFGRFKKCPMCGFVNLSKTQYWIRDFVMSYGVQGVDVATIAKKQHWSLAAAATMLSQLERLGILYREMRPQNKRYRPRRYVYFKTGIY